jgi:hypothetical protein
MKITKNKPNQVTNTFNPASTALRNIAIITIPILAIVLVLVVISRGNNLSTAEVPRSDLSSYYGEPSYYDESADTQEDDYLVNDKSLNAWYDGYNRGDRYGADEGARDAVYNNGYRASYNPDEAKFTISQYEFNGYADQYGADTLASFNEGFVIGYADSYDLGYHDPESTEFWNILTEQAYQDEYGNWHDFTEDW